MNFNKPSKDKIRIASFDIGKKNFAQYIEDADIPTLEKLEKEYHNLPKKLQRKYSGPMNSDIEKIINEIFLSSTRIQTGVYDLRDDKTSNALDIKTRSNLLNHLESYNALWNTCDIFIIERQYFRTWNIKRGKKGKGSEANVSAIQLAEVTLTWLMNSYPLKEIMYFGSENKTQILGAPPKISKSERKRWAIEKCREIYELRQDFGMVEIFKLNDRIFRKRLTNEKNIEKFLDTYPQGKCSIDCIELSERVVRERQKLDDIGDACTQAQAFKFKNIVALF